MIKALIFCQVEHKKSEQVVEQLNKIAAIKKVFSLTGDYDILAEIEVDTTEKLYESFVKNIDLIDGILVTNTHVVMKEFSK